MVVTGIAVVEWQQAVGEDATQDPDKREIVFEGMEGG